MKTEFWLGNLMGNVHLEDQGARKIRDCEDGRRIPLAHDRVKWPDIDIRNVLDVMTNNLSSE
jgi:hypothetical protein